MSKQFTDAPTEQGWITHRGHDHGKKDYCLASCRYGETWPTLRLLPGEKEKFEKEARNPPAYPVKDTYQ